MAPKITSSSNRSKRQAASKAVVRSSKGRANRQSVSTAKITEVSDKSPRQRTGTARVTGDTQRALPPGRRGGDMVKAPNTKPQGTGGPVEQVRVRDLGSRKPGQVSGAPNRPAVPAGNKGGPVTLYQSRRPFRQTGPGDIPRPTQAKPAASSGLKAGAGNAVAGLIAAAAEPMVAAAGQKMGRALGNRVLKPIGRAIDDRLPGINSRDEAMRKQKAQPLPRMAATDMAKAVRLKQYEPTSANKSSAAKPPAAAKLPTPQTSRAAVSNSSQAQGSAPAKKPAEPAKPGQKFEDFNPNRGTSESNNPMLGDYLRSKMAAREGKGFTTGVGPVKSGDGYASALRIEKNKKKKG